LDATKRKKFVDYEHPLVQIFIGTLMKYITGLFLLLLPVFVSASGVVDPTMGTYEDKIKLKQYIEQELPGIDQLPANTKVHILRNLVYQRVKVGATTDFRQTQYQLVIDSLTGYASFNCSGISYIYIALLQLYEIPSRGVQLVSKECLDKPGCKTHIAVEVFIDNEWIAQDPTFNIEWSYDGKRIGFRELRKIYQDNDTPSHNNNGYTAIQNQKRTIEEYPTPYKKLLANMWFNDIYLWPTLPKSAATS
jgi:hypothetical protein